MKKTKPVTPDIAPTLSPRFVAYLRSYLLDRGADVDAIFLEGGLENGVEGENTKPLPVVTGSRIFEIAAQKTGDRHFGLHMAEAFHYESSGLMIMTMLAAPSVEVGLKTMARYDQYIDPGLTNKLVLAENQAEWIVNVVDPRNAENEQLNEFLVALLPNSLKMATRQSVPLRQVCFQHRSSKSPQVLERALGAPVRFGQESNKLVFDSWYLKEPFTTSNSLLFEILTKALHTYFSTNSENFDLLEAVCREVIRQTAAETPSIESVADSLALSARTLRRKLSEEGTSFQDVKRQAMENRAKYFLTQTNMSLSQIALELGYSEPSAFSRAFRAWSNETPQQYRQRTKPPHLKN